MAAEYYNCQSCELEFLDKQLKVEHEICEHGILPTLETTDLACPHCQKIFVQKRYFNFHVDNFLCQNILKFLANKEDKTDVKVTSPPPRVESKKIKVVEKIKPSSDKSNSDKPTKPTKTKAKETSQKRKLDLEISVDEFSSEVSEAETITEEKVNQATKPVKIWAEKMFSDIVKQAQILPQKRKNILDDNLPESKPKTSAPMGTKPKSSKLQQPKNSARNSEPLPTQPTKKPKIVLNPDPVKKSDKKPQPPVNTNLPFKCEDCGQGFSGQFPLKIHLQNCEIHKRNSSRKKISGRTTHNSGNSGKSNESSDSKMSSSSKSGGLGASSSSNATTTTTAKSKSKPKADPPAEKTRVTQPRQVRTSKRKSRVSEAKEDKKTGHEVSEDQEDEEEESEAEAISEPESEMTDGGSSIRTEKTDDYDFEASTSKSKNKSIKLNASDELTMPFTRGLRIWDPHFSRHD